MENSLRQTLAALIACLFALAGCGALVGNTPLAVCQRCLKAQQRGDVNELITYFPSDFVEKLRTMGVDMKAILSDSIRKARAKGGIVATNAQEEKTVGDIVYMKYTVSYGNGTTESGRMPFKMYNGSWKVAPEVPQ